MTNESPPSSGSTEAADTADEISLPTPIKDAADPVCPNEVDEDSYIVRRTTEAIRFAKRLTPYSILARSLFPNVYGNWRFVDNWVVGHVCLAAACWLLLSNVTNTFLLAPFLVYGLVRVWEVCVTTLDVMLGGRPDAEFTVRSLRRSLILGVLNYIEVMFWFAAAYAYFASHFGQNAPLVSTTTGSFYFSILTMATYGDISPQTTFARWLVTVHLLLAIYLTIGVLARLVSTLPRPRPRDRSEE